MRILALAAFLGACNTTGNSDTDLKVINGITASSGEYRGVVRIFPSQGSGTFINDRTVITAGHCVVDQTTFLQDKPYVQNPSTGQLVYATEVRLAPGFPALFKKYMAAQASFAEFTAKDLAVLVFPPGTGAALGMSASDYKPVATVAAKADDQIYVVGYGYKDYNDPSTLGVRRWGTNRVDYVTEFQLAFEGGLSPTAGVDSKVASGDSGGPVLSMDQKIVGVISSSPSSNVGNSNAVNLLGSAVKPLVANLLSGTNVPPQPPPPSSNVAKLAGSGYVSKTLSPPPTKQYVSVTFAPGCHGPWVSGLFVNAWTNEADCTNCPAIEENVTGPWRFDLGTPTEIKWVGANLSTGGCEYTLTFQ